MDREHIGMMLLGFLSLVIANCASDPDYSVSENFDNFTAGEGICEASSYDWELLDDNGDGRISDDRFVSEPHSLEVDRETDVALFLSYDGGTYQVNFQMYVVNAGGYAFRGVPSGLEDDVSVFEVYFFLNGNGIVYVDDEQVAEFEFPIENWMSISHVIDLAGDTATLTIDGQTIHEWQYSIPIGGEGDASIESLEFFGYAAPGSVYYVDDIEAFKI